MTTRESVFLCTFRTSRGEERAWIRAWSAEQAAAAVRELVGGDVDGAIRVERPRPRSAADDAASAAR